MRRSASTQTPVVVWEGMSDLHRPCMRLIHRAWLSCSEKDAATLCRTIVKVVGHCHSLGVMHRCGHWLGAKHLSARSWVTMSDTDDVPHSPLARKSP